MTPLIVQAQHGPSKMLNTNCPWGMMLLGERSTLFAQKMANFFPPEKAIH